MEFLPFDIRDHARWRPRRDQRRRRRKADAKWRGEVKSEGGGKSVFVRWT